MTTPLVPATPTSPATATASPATSTAPAGSTTNATEPSPPAKLEWRAPANAPAWAAGKSADEILGISQQMYSVLERFNQQAAAQPQPQQPQRPATQAAPVPGETLADEDYINGAQLKRYLAGQAPQYVQPQLQQLYAQNASTAISLVQQQFPDDFKRYGAEIHSRIALMPLEYRTVDNLVSQVKFVRSEHLDQLVEEKAEARAQEMRAQMASGLRSSGAPIGGPGPTDNGNTAGYLQNEVIPDKWKRLAEKVNLTESTLQDFCRQNDMTPEQFVELFKGNVMIDTMATGSLKEDRVKTI